MPDQFLFSIAERQQGSDRFSLPFHHSCQNHRDHSDHHDQNDRAVHGKLGDQIIRLLINQADPRIRFLLHIFHGTVFFIDFGPKRSFFFFVSIADGIVFHARAQALYRFLT